MDATKLTVDNIIAEVRRRGSPNLSLVGLGLTQVPSEIESLIGLRHLNLSRNNLATIPEWLPTLSDLKSLDLSNNRLTHVAPSITRLTDLECLYLSYNRIAQLPASLRRLQRLVRLDVTGNQLGALPTVLAKMPSLRELYLHDNEYLGLPEEILGSRWPALQDLGVPRSILRYYAAVRDASKPLNEAKLIVVGRGGVGKTSLVNRLLHDKFDTYEVQTHGINIGQWILSGSNAEPLQLHVWDFGGQEIMHATHQFFLTHRSLYLLVVSGREGMADADAEYWLKLIEAFGGNSPVIIAQNKVREHPCEINRSALERKYPIREFVSTDCEDRTGIAELTRAIAQEAQRLPHMSSGFPARWISVKERLAAMRENYLTFRQYRRLCVEHGVNDHEAQSALASYLHDLGITLNYTDDPRLHDTHVLNPHWVTSGIYAVLNSPRVSQNRGELHFRDLDGILSKIEYPVAMRRFLMDLMKKFDLCFSFLDDEFRYLIPELLHKQEPVEAKSFNPQECLNFRYRYPVLPEGLLPRFIVRSRILSEGLPRWRTGVMLAFERSRALVRADIPERTIEIMVIGPPPGRRELLAIIRHDLDRIHAEIPNLRVEPMVPLPGHPLAEVPYRELAVMDGGGVETFPKVVGDEVIEVSVRRLLDGVGFPSPTRATDPITVFYSYSHKDELLRKELENHLALLKRQHLIDSWFDRNIDAGADWQRQIAAQLERAKIVLLLISSDFIASEYCYNIEMRRALERHEAGETRVIPIIVRDVNWRIAPFANLQALPTDGRAVTTWPDRDSAWRNVSEGLELLLRSMQSRDLTNH